MPEQPETTAEADRRNLPVLAAEARPIDRPESPAVPAPVVAATGGFLAGIATFVVLRVLRGRPRAGIRLGRRRRGPRSLEVAGSRSFLVDVHVLKR